MPRAIWNGLVVAESDACEVVEGNVYFPPNAIDVDLLRPSDHTTVCGWKGRADYFDLVAEDGAEARNAAWMYRHPKPEARRIADYVAFYSPPVTIER